MERRTHGGGPSERVERLESDLVGPRSLPLLFMSLERGGGGDLWSNTSFLVLFCFFVRATSVRREVPTFDSNEAVFERFAKDLHKLFLSFACVCVSGKASCARGSTVPVGGQILRRND